MSSVRAPTTVEPHATRVKRFVLFPPISPSYCVDRCAFYVESSHNHYLYSVMRCSELSYETALNCRGKKTKAWLKISRNQLPSYFCSKTVLARAV